MIKELRNWPQCNRNWRFAHTSCLFTGRALTKKEEGQGTYARPVDNLCPVPVFFSFH